MNSIMMMNAKPLRGVICASSLVAMAVSCATGRASPDVGANSHDRRGTPAVTEAARILDEDNWYMKNEVLRAELQSGNSADEARARSQIALQEVAAIQQFVAANIPDDKRNDCLERWTGHHNNGVAAIAAGQLMSSGDWASIPLIRRHMVDWDRATQVQLMQTFVGKAFHPEMLPLVRAFHDELMADAAPCETPQGNIASFTIAKFLVQSSDEQDRERILALLDRCQDSPQLWLAASRASVPDRLARSAETIFADDSRATALRAAAGLVAAQRREAVYEQVWVWIRDYLDQFATDQGTDAVTRAGQRPLEADSRELVQKYQIGQTMLAVLRELPTRVLVANIDALVSHQAGMPGACTAAILAKRVPVEYLTALTSDGKPVTPNIYPAVLMVGMVQPKLADRAEKLLPSGAATRLKQQAAEYGVSSLAGACVHLTLWD